MFSEFLTRVLTRSMSSGGCGMSTRPEYYSGRGATSSDLNSGKLTTLYQAIVAQHGEAAGAAFTSMVAAIPKLSATDFLIALAHLERNEWVFDPEMVGKSNGTYATDRMTAFATIFSVLGNPDRDETVYIRGEFLRSRGVKEPRGDRRMSPYGYMYGDD